MKEFIVETDLDLSCVAEFTGAGCISFKPHGELIRCKDCKHWQCDDYETYCDELGIFGTDMNSYCSYAKRKEE